MDSPPDRKPDPRPQPGPGPVCHNNCGAIYLDGARLEEITCPCGYGYYDSRQNKFIEGSLVRNGRAPTREQYVAHVRQCALQERGAPKLRSPHRGEPDLPLYLGVDPPDHVSDERASGYAAAQSTSSVLPSRRAEDATISSSTRHTTSRATKQKTTTAIRQESGATASAPRWSFIPEEGILMESLVFFTKTFVDKDAKFKVGPHWDDKQLQGFWIESRKPLSQANLTDIKLDSKDWVKEKMKSRDVNYSGSKVVARRRKSGPTNEDQSTTSDPLLDMSGRIHNSQFPQLSPELTNSLPSFGSGGYPEQSRHRTSGPDDIRHAPTTVVGRSITENMSTGKENDPDPTRHDLNRSYNSRPAPNPAANRRDSGISVPSHEIQDSGRHDPTVPYNNRQARRGSESVPGSRQEARRYRDNGSDSDSEMTQRRSEKKGSKSQGRR